MKIYIAIYLSVLFVGLFCLGVLKGRELMLSRFALWESIKQNYTDRMWMMVLWPLLFVPFTLFWFPGWIGTKIAKRSKCR